MSRETIRAELDEMLTHGAQFVTRQVKKAGPERVIDRWAVIDANGLLKRINLGRWNRTDPEVAAAIIEARAALQRLERAISTSEIMRVNP